MEKTDKKKLLITGASGMVGKYVNEMFYDDELILTDLVSNKSKLDITDSKEVLYWIKEVKPHVVLHLAAATDVDLCERDPEYAYWTNFTGTENIAKACQQYNSTLVYISTGAIFNGYSMIPYSEEDLPDPVTVYGKSKWLGEKAITSLLKNFYIVRAGWMMGGGQRDKKFVGKITQKILSGEKILKIVNDKFGSPTYAKDMLKAIKNLLLTNTFGIYHAANGFGCSRYDVALEIKSILNAQDVSILPVSSTEFNLDVPRASSEQMINGCFIKQKYDWMRDWKEALRDYLLNDYLVDFNKK